MTVKNFGLNGVHSNVQFGKSGPRIKNNAGVFEAKNAADNAFVTVSGAAPTADEHFVTKKYLETRADVIINGQIDGGAPPSPVDGLIYIVTTAGGGYALNELYRREGGSWVAVPLIDGLKISVADPISGGVDEYEMGVYMYDLDTTAWIFVGPLAETAKIDKNEIVTLAFGDTSPLDIGAQIPVGAIVKKISVNVTQAFDGTAPVLDIGDAGDADRFMSSAENDLKTVGLYLADVHYLYGSTTQPIATFDADSSTVGQASLLIEYKMP